MAASVPAATVVGATTIESTTPLKGASHSFATYQQKCWTANLPLTAKSYLGDTIYKWHHTFSWCTANQHNGDELTRVLTALWSRYDYVTNAQSVVNVENLVTDSQSPLGSYVGINSSGYNSAAWSHMSRKTNLCIVNFGCYASNYPESKIHMGRDSNYISIADAY